MINMIAFYGLLLLGAVCFFWLAGKVAERPVLAVLLYVLFFPVMVVADVLKRTK